MIPDNPMIDRAQAQEDAQDAAERRKDEFTTGYMGWATDRFFVFEEVLEAMDCDQRTALNDVLWRILQESTRYQSDQTLDLARELQRKLWDAVAKEAERRYQTEQLEQESFSAWTQR